MSLSMLCHKNTTLEEVSSLKCITLGFPTHSLQIYFFFHHIPHASGHSSFLTTQP